MAGSAVLYLRHRARRARPEDFDLMEGHDFEYYCAEILRKNGFQEVEVTKGSGDYGIDILAQKDGVTYAIQCKCYTAPVGVNAVQEAFAGRGADQPVFYPACGGGRREAEDTAVGQRVSGGHGGGGGRLLKRPGAAP